MSVTSQIDSEDQLESRGEVWCCLCGGTRLLEYREHLNWYPAIQRHADPHCMAQLIAHLRESDPEIAQLIFSVLHVGVESVRCLLCQEGGLSSCWQGHFRFDPDGDKTDMEWNEGLQAYAHMCCTRFEVWRSQELGLDISKLRVKLNNGFYEIGYFRHLRELKGIVHNMNKPAAYGGGINYLRGNNR